MVLAPCWQALLLLLLLLLLLRRVLLPGWLQAGH
jgi:hypothetical protein